MAAAVGCPAVLGLMPRISPHTADTIDPVPTDHDAPNGLTQQAPLIADLDRSFRIDDLPTAQTACFALSLDDLAHIRQDHGDAVAEAFAARVCERLESTKRDNDRMCTTDDGGFAVVLHPSEKVDNTVALRVAKRIQEVLTRPITLGEGTFVSACSIGYCLSNLRDMKCGADLFDAAHLALAEARRKGPSGICAFEADMRQTANRRRSLSDQIAKALENDEIIPWFQPQVSTHTGGISGFEALARWVKADGTIVPPGEFLPAAEEAGLIEHMGEKILYQSLKAMQSWSRAGLVIPSVAVNFSTAELRNPKLVERIEWELDRFDLQPEQLTVEILETVVASSPDDIVARNIAALAALGCLVDLDDFGTGHASITSIRRFAVHRIKIDRSFVRNIDTDRDQRRMVMAILSMAERLGLDTLAEGVETMSEHSLLAQLGCGHVQGFGLAKPMPFEHTLDWIPTHQAQLDAIPQIAKKYG